MDIAPWIFGVSLILWAMFREADLPDRKMAALVAGIVALMSGGISFLLNWIDTAFSGSLF